MNSGASARARAERSCVARMELRNDAGMESREWTHGSPWLLGVVVSLVAMVAMCGALGGPFVYDDVPLIKGNSYVHNLENWRRWFSEPFVDTNMEPSLARQSRVFFRPLVLATYALDWQWTGGQPWGFHVTNLLIHATNSFLLWLLLRGWCVRQWAAGVAALVFAVHPTQTETVVWISGRTDALCLLGLLSAALSLRWILASGLQRGRQVAGATLCLTGLLVAFGSKEAAVVFPVLFGVEFWAQRGEPLEGPSLRRLTAQTLPLFVLALGYVIVHRISLDPGPSVGTPRAILRLPYFLEAIGRYVALIIVPTDVTMGRALLHYENGELTPVWIYVVVGLLALVSGGWLAGIQRRVMPALSVGLLATVASMMPVSSVIWLGYDVLVAPRFLYIPMVGVALVVAAVLSASVPVCSSDGGEGFSASNGPRRAIGWTCALAATALFGLSFLRSLDYLDEDAFWQRELEETPHWLAAQRYFVGRELKEGRPRAGVMLAQHYFSTSPLPDHFKASLVHEAVAGLSAVIPDRDKVSLRTLQRFVRELVAEKGGQLVLPEFKLSLRIPEGSRLAKTLGGDSRRLELLLAEMAARLGDDADARELAGRALAECDDCWIHMLRAARVFAQCGEIERAQELASRAARLTDDPTIPEMLKDFAFARKVFDMSRASSAPALVSQYYAVLGAFGRAYEAAAPAFDQPPKDPEAIRGLAELAIRAGDVSRARELLSEYFLPQQVEAQIEAVLQTVPWRDQPRSAEEWTPGPIAVASGVP